MKHLLSCLPLVLAIATLASDKPKNGYTQEQLRPFLAAKIWTVFSLDPTLITEGQALEDPFGAPVPGSKETEATPAPPKPKLPPDQVFHDYPILGQHTLPVTQDMKLIIQDLDRAGQLLEEGNGGPLCYFPRHGIRVVEGGRVHDLQICYQCTTANLFVGTKNVGCIFFGGKGLQSPQAPNPNALNSILKKAGVMISPY